MKSTCKPIAVISGDVVDSTKLSSTQFESLLTRIKDTQQLISVGHPLNAHSIGRGDEFQSVIHDIENALRYSILYRMNIKALGKGFDCRISFAIASSADLRDLVSESMGDAFVLSGRGLTALKGDRFVFSSDRKELVGSFHLLFKYLDRQLSELTSRQCQVMLPMLSTGSNLSISELAQKLDIAMATASKSLKASGWSLINQLEQTFAGRVKDGKYV